MYADKKKMKNIQWIVNFSWHENKYKKKYKQWKGKKQKKNSKRNFNIIVYINKHFFKLSFKKNIKIK